MARGSDPGSRQQRSARKRSSLTGNRLPMARCPSACDSFLGRAVQEEPEEVVRQVSAHFLRSILGQNNNATAAFYVVAFPVVPS